MTRIRAVTTVWKIVSHRAGNPVAMLTMTQRPGRGDDEHRRQRPGRVPVNPGQQPAGGRSGQPAGRSRPGRCSAAIRPANPGPTGMRTACRTSSSSPAAAVAISCPEEKCSRSTVAVSARGISRVRSSSLTSSLPSWTPALSRSRELIAPAAGEDGNRQVSIRSRRINPHGPGSDYGFKSDADHEEQT